MLETSPLDPEYPDAEPLGFVSYTGTGEERNRLHVTRGSRGRLLFVDRGARRLVLKGPGCFHLSRRRALCRPPEDASSLSLGLGRGADRAVMDSTSFRASADLVIVLSVFASSGEGDDTVLVREPTLTELRGGRGDDRLKAARGNGDNFIYGGPGDDALVGPDSFVEGDVGDDYLRGGFLEGEAGDDRLVAERGGSFLQGGSGNDVLIGSATPSVFGPISNSPSEYGGGPGNDRLRTANGRRESTPVDCGGGRDRIRADRKDRLRRCERVTRVSR